MIKFIFKLFALLAFVCVGGYFLFCATILIWTTPNIAKQSHDAIIVLTGASGRIEKGFELLLDERASTLLISGVLDRLSFKEVIKNNSDGLTGDQKNALYNHCCITLDYIADSTETNATESAKWIKKNNIQSIILVTSDNHMPRSYMQFHVALDNEIIITPYPYRAKNRLHMILSSEFWRYAVREYIKLGGSLIRIIRHI